MTDESSGCVSYHHDVRQAETCVLPTPWDALTSTLYGGIWRSRMISRCFAHGSTPAPRSCSGSEPSGISSRNSGSPPGWGSPPSFGLALATSSTSLPVGEPSRISDNSCSSSSTRSPRSATSTAFRENSRIAVAARFSSEARPQVRFRSRASTAFEVDAWSLPTAKSTMARRACL